MKNYTLVVMLLLCSSCVSKKKYLEVVSSFETQQDSLQAIIQNKNIQIDTLKSALSFSRGGNSALLVTQDRLQDRLDELQLEIDRLNQNASSSQSNFGDRIQELRAEINAYQGRIDQVKNLLQTRDDRLITLESQLKDTLASEEDLADLFETRIKSGQLILALNETTLFNTGSTSRIKESGKTVLEKIVTMLNGYPEMRIQAIGHTDNKPVNRQSLDNWQYAALRAVSIVKFMTGEAGLSPSRIVAASSGKSAPKTSNETSEGRAENRRIELVIFASDSDLQRDLGRILD